MMSSLMPSREIFLLRIAAHVGERQNADGQAARRFRPRRACPRCAPAARTAKTCTGRSMFLTVCSPRSSNAHGDLARHLVAHRARDRDAADRRQRLQPRGDVDAFAVDVVALDDDVAEIDADAIADALRFGALRLGARRRLLDRQRAVDGGDHAREFDQRAVAHQLDDAPAVRGDAGIEDPASVDLQPFERAGLVGLHQAAVADDVGGKDRGQFALHRSALERGSATLLTPYIQMLQLR